MSINKVNIGPNLIKAAIVTILGFLIAITSLHRLLNLLDFTKSSDGADFQMSDVYNRVADSRSVRTLSRDVVIVPLDGYGRQEIANIIGIVNSLNPKAIGLDIMFIEEYESDEILISEIEGCDKLILPLALDEDNGNCSGSYFYDTINHNHFGVVNLEAFSGNERVRTYRPEYRWNEMTINSFAVEIASVASPESYQKISSQAKSSGTISYPSVEFPIVEISDLMLEPEGYRTMIENKIVLLGDLQNTSDYHLTPVSNGMPGILIHAHIVDTIVSGKQVKAMARWICWLIAILLCYVFVCIKLFICERSDDIGQLVIRVLQIMFLYLFFIIGCNTFINHMLYVDFSPTLLMITIALFICDVWEGCVSLFIRIFKKEKI